MNRASFIPVFAVGLVLIGLAAAKLEWGSQTLGERTGLQRSKIAKPTFALRVLDQSDNMKCSVQGGEGGAVLKIAPPSDVNRIMVIRVVKTNVFLDANGNSEPVAGPGKPDALVFDSRDAEAFEFENFNMTSRKVRMFSSEGQYDFLLAESFEEDWEYEFPEAWCKVEVTERK